MPKLLENEILKVEHLKKYFPIKKGFLQKVTGYIRAVDDVNLTIKNGETMGMVGESGCGKTTFSRTILRAVDPTEGNVIFRKSNGQEVDIAKLDKKMLREVRKDVQMIFQDPNSSLNPRMPVLDIVGEFLLAHGWSKKDAKEKVADLLNLVGLESHYMSRYPHEFSGGQRQRIGIARALALEPSLIVADEPVSALDVSVQAQILNLMDELQEELGLSYLFVAHDLSVVRYICDKISVMYLGKIVEVAVTNELYENPLHPYTSGLLSAVPDADPHHKWEFGTIKGEIADSSKIIQGCPFASRCEYSREICYKETPELKMEDADHQVACHRSQELNLKGVV